VERKKLVIVGAGGFGREIASMVLTTQLCETWDLQGFLDDDPAKQNDSPLGLRVLGGHSYLRDNEDVSAVCCIGEPLARRHFAMDIAGWYRNWTSLIHPSAWVGAQVSIGPGVILAANTVVTCDAHIGEHVHLNCYSSVGHDALVSAFATAASHVDITGGARIGECCYIGSGARVLPNVALGERSVLGAGAVANRDIPNDTVAVGVPARVIKRRPEGFNPAYVTASTRE
jgi:sugar O-acyltransferase (sialic acid O-acetyltransferase NeuD family)